jgi:predicted nucleic acid-binding protein
METLVSRPAFAKPLLEQIAAGRIPRVDLTAFQARQIRSLNDAALTRRLTEVWGELHESSVDKQKLIADLSLSGNDLNDAWLAALALEHGAILVSTDEGFARFPGLAWQNPARA